MCAGRGEDGEDVDERYALYGEVLRAAVRLKLWL